MKKVILMLYLVVAFALSSCTTPAESVERSTEKPTADIFAFQMKDEIYIAYNSDYINYVFKVGTDKIQYSDAGQSFLVITDKENIYQINYSYINSFSDRSDDTDKKILDKYYLYKKIIRKKKIIIYLMMILRVSRI